MALNYHSGRVEKSTTLLSDRMSPTEMIFLAERRRVKESVK